MAEPNIEGAIRLLLRRYEEEILRLTGITSLALRRWARRPEQPAVLKVIAAEVFLAALIADPAEADWFLHQGTASLELRECLAESVRDYSQSIWPAGEPDQAIWYGGRVIGWLRTAIHPQLRWVFFRPGLLLRRRDAGGWASTLSAWAILGESMPYKQVDLDPSVFLRRSGSDG